MIMLLLLDACPNRKLPEILPENHQLRPALARAPRIPDLLTTANLICGVLSTTMASRGDLSAACWLIFIAAIFDVLDGLAARALGGGSELGKQLDSLADMVSFGVAPGFLVYQLVGQPLSGLLYLQYAAQAGPDLLSWVQLPAYLVGLAIPVAAAWRLAKFNIDPRQTGGFLGLPTPANALFWAGLFLGLSGKAVLAEGLVGSFIGSSQWPWWMAAAVFLLAALMLVEIPLPSLKFKRMGWRGNEVMLVLAVLGVALAVPFGFLAVPLLLILYLLSPVWGRIFPKLP